MTKQEAINILERCNSEVGYKSPNSRYSILSELLIVLGKAKKFPSKLEITDSDGGEVREMKTALRVCFDSAQAERAQKPELTLA